MTVRQVFYQAVSRGLVAKTEQDYKNAVGRLLLGMRREQILPYDWIADATRWMRKPSTYSGLAAFIERHQNAYRRDLWAESDTYIEIWCEKEALAGVIYDVTHEYDVALMVSRGFASESYLYSSAESIDDQLFGDADKRYAAIYYFGDYDPSGLKVGTSVEAGIRRILSSEFGWSPILHGFLTFERVAITPEQARRLPTRPTKIKDNRHALDWAEGEGSVELDALPAGELRDLVREAIEQHVDQDQLVRLRKIEREERQQLAMFGQSLRSS